MFVGFLIGCLVGSVLTGIALLLAIGVTSTRDYPPVPTELLEGSRRRRQEYRGWEITEGLGDDE